jgi:hypothetical protein
LLLGRSIKFNEKLKHMDLSGTGLTTFIIEGLGPVLKRSRSLQCLHLDGNPGLDQKRREFLVKRMAARPNEDMDRFKQIQTIVK